MSSKSISIGILIAIVIIIVIYSIVMFETLKHGTFIFAPYTPPAAPNGAFYPNGEMTTLTTQQFEERQQFAKCSICLNWQNYGSSGSSLNTANYATPGLLPPSLVGQCADILPTCNTSDNT